MFAEDDPRRTLSLSSLDPRIHFALVCGAKSCPPVRLFRADSVLSDLATCSKNFVQQEVVVDVDAATVTVSRLFLWYGCDFKEAASVDDTEMVSLLPHEYAWLHWIARHFMGSEHREALLRVLTPTNAGKTGVVKFADYDWRLNGKS